MHQEFLLENPEARLLLTDEDCQVGNYPAIEELGRAKAKVIADMESVAYNERTKSIRELIIEQLNQSLGCTFGRNFILTLMHLLIRSNTRLI